MTVGRHNGHGGDPGMPKSILLIIATLEHGVLIVERDTSGTNQYKTCIDGALVYFPED